MSKYVKASDEAKALEYTYKLEHESNAVKYNSGYLPNARLAFTIWKKGNDEPMGIFRYGGPKEIVDGIISVLKEKEFTNELLIYLIDELIKVCKMRDAAKEDK